MSPTVPTTTHPPDSWIRLRPSSLPSSTLGAMSNLIRVDQSTRQRCDDGLKGNKIADAYGRPLDICDDSGEENNGNRWLLTHHGGPSLSLNDSWRDYHEPMTIETAEFWIHQLRSVLHETRSNLNLIVAFHHRQMQKQNQSFSGLNSKPSGTMMSKSVAVQTNNEMKISRNENKASEFTNESKLNHRKSVALTGLHPDGSIIPAVTSKPKKSIISLDECRFASNSCCSLSTHHCLHGANKTSNRQTIPPSHHDDCRKRNSHDRQWNKNVDTTALLLNDAWQLAGLHTRQRMSVLSRHYRILYRRHCRLRKRHRHLNRSMRRTCHQSRYLQHQLQILLESIVSQVDEVASDWVDRLKGLLDNATADSSSSNHSNSPLDFTAQSSVLSDKGSERLKSSPTYNSFSLYRWYSSLSMKLSWIQTSHRNVIDNIVLFQRISRDV